MKKHGKLLPGHRRLPIFIFLLLAAGLAVSLAPACRARTWLFLLPATVAAAALLIGYILGEERFAAEMWETLGRMTDGKEPEPERLKDAFARELLESLPERLKSSAEQEYRNEISNRKAELATLQGQINPHFLYNTLDSIRGEAIICGADEIADMTEALAMIFRYCISIRGDLVTLSDEIKNIKSYLLIQKFRFEDRFVFVMDVDASDEVMNYYIPKLTLQPLVENALFHGLELRKEGGVLRLRIRETDRSLIIRVEDNGRGIEPGKLAQINLALRRRDDSISSERAGKGEGIALVNVNERIKLTFGDEYGVVLYSSEGLGTSVEMTIPKRRVPEND